MQNLPGSQYATVAIPLDYPPSRDYRARWGNTRPPIEPLMKWFGEGDDRYRAFIHAMHQESQFAKDIPLMSDSLPRWTEVAYSPFDALVLHTMIAVNKPKRYLEIGSGATTSFAHHAIKSHNLSTKIVSIDPNPRAQIDAICDSVIRDGLETCDIELFSQLGAGDILFFDGSHRSFMNSDVTVFFIDVLPRLKPGVIVHIHDIHLPWDYDEWSHVWYWNEQYMLAVYLMGHMNRIDMLLPTRYVTRQLPEATSHPFIDFGEKNNHWKGGGAIWFTHKN